MKRILTAFLCICMLCMCGSISVPAAAAQTELIGNGGFEKDTAGWTLKNGTEGTFQIDSEVYNSGAKSLRILNTAGSTSGAIYYAYYQIKQIVAEETYTFSCRVKNPAGGGVSVMFEFYAGNDQATRLGNQVPFTCPTGEDWQTLGGTLQAPENCRMIMVYLRHYGNGGSVWFDDISLTADTAVLADTFAGENETIKASVDGTLLLQNGGFEDALSSNNWRATNAVLTTTAKDGSGSVQTNGGGFVYQIFDVQAMGKYQVHGYVNTESITGAVRLKAEYYTAEGTGLGYDYSDSFPSTFGLWRQFVFDFNPPENTTKVWLYLLCYGDSHALWDSVSAYKTEHAKTLRLETDWIFYYSDWQTGTAIVTSTEAGIVDFALLDGEQILDTQTEVPLTSGTASYAFPVGKLQEAGKAYTIRATRKGTYTEKAETEVYCFPRPTVLDQNGVYYSEGKPFYPIIGMTLEGIGDLHRCVAMGMNVLTCKLSLVDAFVEEVKKLEADIKVIPLLYNYMQPAWSEVNKDKTKELVEKYKDEDAIFAWAIMDEPTANLSSEEDLLASYLNIRKIDSHHPVYVCDNGSTEKMEIAGKYCDILAMDSYVGAGNPATHTATSLKWGIDGVKEKKPVYSVVQAFEYGGYFPTAEAMENMLCQSFSAGAKGIGYYCFCGAQGEKRLDETEIADTITAFNTQYAPILFEHFALGQSMRLADGEDTNKRYHIWDDGENTYLLVGGKTKEEQTVSVMVPDTIPASSAVRRVFGAGESETWQNGVLSVTLAPAGAAMYSFVSRWVENGGFENDMENWTAENTASVSIETSGAFAGDAALAIENNAGINQTMSGLSPQKTYVLSFWAKTETGGSVSCIVSLQNDAGTAFSAPVTLSGTGQDWFCRSTSFTVPTECKAVKLYFEHAGEGKVWLDNVCIAPVPTEAAIGLYDGADNVTQVQEGNYTLLLERPAQNADTVWVFLAAYKGQQLIFMEKFANIQKLSNAALVTEIPVRLQVPSADCLKLFYWDNSMQPYTDTVEFVIEEDKE